MASSSHWLATLQRIREHRRDVARQSLAQSLQAARDIREKAIRAEATLTTLGKAQLQTGQTGRLDPERLQQIRQDRDVLKSHRDALRRQQSAADAAVHQAQTEAAAKDAEAEVLRKLQDRLDSAHRQAQRRRDEQTSIEVAISLCNGRLAD